MKIFESYENIIRAAAISLWFLVFLAGMWAYPGRKEYYAVFSVVYGILGVSAFWRQRSYGYTFFVIFLWLGFWFKSARNFIFNYAYVEPTGAFDFSPYAWDQVLVVSIVGAAGLLSAYLVSRIVFNPKECYCNTPPSIYKLSRVRFLWAAIFVTLVVAVLNSYFGIHKVGIVPHTVLPWPGNAIVAWALNIGLAMVFATFICWDSMSGNKSVFTFLAVSFECLTSSVSILSRGIFVYHGIPLFFSAFRTKILPRGYSRINLALIVSVFFISFASSVFMVNAMRRNLYSSGPSPKCPQKILYSVPPVSQIYEPVNSPIRKLVGLATSRWIGIEGVMALQAYPVKTISLLKRALCGSREIGTVSAFEEISRSHYQDIDRTRFEFGSLPGPIGLLYFSGKLWLVFLGMAFLGVLVVLFEEVVLLVTGNPLMCSLLGMMAANHAAQLSEAPRQLLPTYIMTLCALAVIGVFSGRLILKDYK